MSADPSFRGFVGTNATEEYLFDFHFPKGAHMNSPLIRLICRFLIASMLLMSLGAARAGMIGADQAAGGGHSDRAIVMSTLDRSDVANGLRAHGVDPQDAKNRVAAMTDDEVSALKGRIDTVPAGAKSHSGYWIAGVILIAIIIWYAWR